MPLQWKFIKQELLEYCDNSTQIESENQELLKQQNKTRYLTNKNICRLTILKHEFVISNVKTTNICLLFWPHCGFFLIIVKICWFSL